MTGEGPADVFPGPGAPWAAAVVRSSNLAGPGTYRCSIADGTDRGLTSDVRHNGRDKVESVDGSKVVQNAAGDLPSWILLNPDNQPDRGPRRHHRAAVGDPCAEPATAVQARLPAAGLPAPDQPARRLRVRANPLSHHRQASSAVAEDLGHLIAVAEMREQFYTCPAHKQVHLSPARLKGAERQMHSTDAARPALWRRAGAQIHGACLQEHGRCRQPRRADA
jgi:hypothetical protein